MDQRLVALLVAAAWIVTCLLLAWILHRSD